MNAYQLNLDFRTPEEKEKQELCYKNFVDHFANESLWDKVLDYILYLPYGRRVYNFILDFKFNCKMKYQKIRYGISDNEIWSLSNTIAEFIVPRLEKYMIDTRKKIPGNFLIFNEILYNTGLSEEEIIKQEDAANEKWQNILKEIHFAFDYTRDPDKYVPFPEIEYTTIKKDKPMSLSRLTDKERAMFDIYTANSKKAHERAKKGLILFAENFDYLWD